MMMMQNKVFPSFGHSLGQYFNFFCNIFDHMLLLCIFSALDYAFLFYLLLINLQRKYAFALLDISCIFALLLVIFVLYSFNVLFVHGSSLLQFLRDIFEEPGAIYTTDTSISSSAPQRGGIASNFAGLQLNLNFQLNCLKTQLHSQAPVRQTFPIV